MTVKVGYKCARSIHNTLLPKDYVYAGADGIDTKYESHIL